MSIINIRGRYFEDSSIPVDASAGIQVVIITETEHPRFGCQADAYSIQDLISSVNWTISKRSIGK